MSNSHPVGDRPVPPDDGAAAHLPGRALPAIELLSTDGTAPSLATFGSPYGVLYFYPMTATPGIELPSDWNTIPGARGCTPEACGFRDHHAELRALGAKVIGVSTQSTAEQTEAVQRLGLTFPLLSDPALALRDALALPTFTADDDVERYRRLTLIVRDGVIDHVLYPVFSPEDHAAQVLAWLRSTGAAHDGG